MRPISLVVITLNEEKNIERCLRSASFADDVVVLDSGSRDRTVEIAKSLGARVFIEDWRGFAGQKNRAAELAKHDLILSLDADECLSTEAKNEVQDLLAQLSLEPTATAFAFPRLSYHLGRWIHHGGWYPDWQIRLFDRRVCRWQEDSVHEKIVTSEVGRLRGRLLHYVFRDLSHQIETNNRYSSLGFQRLKAQGLRFSLLPLLVKPIGKFIECYVVKQGFRDGLAGFVIAVGAAYSMFLKFAKLWESEIEPADQFKIYK